MTIEPAVLQKWLLDFEGSPVKMDTIPEYLKLVSGFFTNPERVKDPRVGVTLSDIDITEFRTLYNNDFQNENSTFTAFLKWAMLQAFTREDARWLSYRYINGNWYYFKNLPLELTVVVDDPNILQRLYFIQDPTKLTWEEFSKEHARLSKGPNEHVKKENFEEVLIAHELVRLHFPGNLTGYTTTSKAKDMHQPWVVFQTNSNDPNYLSIHVSFSHAMGTPDGMRIFLNHFFKEMPMQLKQKRLPNLPSSQIPLFTTRNHSSKQKREEVDHADVKKRRRLGVG